jgi:hypothetical protein
MKRSAVLLVLALAAACTGAAPRPAAPARPVAVRSALPTPSPSPTPSPRTDLVAWTGPVEELFFHPLVLRPEQAFRDDPLGHGFQDYFVTARELRGILDGLWRNGWSFVDPHRVAAGTVLVPRGRKPLVLSEDDVNYYRYFRGRGLASRLVLDAAGDVKAEVDGLPSDDDLVPLVDAAVARHPELSADGTKGVLALTGYEGLFGEHEVATDPAARERVRALANRLRQTGWLLASHTYGHIALGRDSVRRIEVDSARWRLLVGDLLGAVDVLVYPFGDRPSPAARQALLTAGFPIQLDIDVRARTVRAGGVTVMSRRHVDGLAFDAPQRLAPFFDVADVRDPQRPG